MRRNRSVGRSYNSIGLVGCSFYLCVIGLYLTLGSMSVNYILSWFDKDIPWIADTFIGMFLVGLTFPLAVCGWVLKLFGVF